MRTLVNSRRLQRRFKLIDPSCLARRVHCDRAVSSVLLPFFLVLCLSGCDQVVGRISDRGESGSSEESRLQPLAQPSTIDPAIGAPPSDETKNRISTTVESRTGEMGTSAPAHISESLNSKGSVKEESRPFALQLNKEVDLGNGVIFDMRPELPEVRRSE